MLVGRIAAPGTPIVVAALPALQAAERTAQITFTQDSWARILGELDERYPDQQIVGWYHTHPGYGLFLSEQDRFIHRHFFSNTAQIALVIDPLAHEEGVFGWVDGEIAELFRRPTAESTVPWDAPGPAGVSSVDATAPARPEWPTSAGGRISTDDRPTTVSPPRSRASPAEARSSARSDARREEIRPTRRAASSGATSSDEWLSLSTCIYLLIIGLAAGVCVWELALR